MMHDFAMTSRHVIFMDLPVVFNLDIAINGRGDMPYRWDDGYGARFGVLRRDDPSVRSAGSRSTRATCSTSPTPTTTVIPLWCRRFATRSCGATTAGSTSPACCGNGPSTWGRER